MKTAIHLQNVHFSYPNHVVLDAMEGDFCESAIHVLIGKNGCGKSTLLQLINGQLKIRNGSIRVLNRDIRELSTKERSNTIGFLGQRHQANFPFSVEDVVLTGRYNHIPMNPGRKDHLQVEKVLEQAGISHLAKRAYSELSGGEQQMVMIARLLAQEPKILLMDEPLTHLDLKNQALFAKLIQNLVASGLTILAVVHDPNFALMYGNVIWGMVNGKLQSLDSGMSPEKLSEELSFIYDTPLAFETLSGFSIVRHRNSGTPGAH